MKKIILINLLMLLIPFLVISQEQLENPGFEDWEDAGTVLEEPVNWSSIKTSDGGTVMNQAAPVVWGQSTDAHAGNYSIKLFNVATFGIIATGIATNGRVHPDFDPTKGYVFTEPADPQWHTPFSSRPDSLVGWFKQNPAGDDFGRIRIILHVESGSLPENGTFQNWIGEASYNFPQGQEVTEWTRFSAPFTYYSSGNPAYILVVLNSGNGTEALEGSVAYFDDLKLVYNPEGLGENLSEKMKVYARNNNIHVDLASANEYKYLEMHIFELTGRQVFSKKFTPGTTNTLSTSLTGGIYICRIISEKGIISRKLYLN